MPASNLKTKYRNFLRNKIVLVTGGTGSIGGELVREILKYPVKQVRVFSRGEHKQFLLQQEIKHLPLGKVTFLIGDIRDKNRVDLAMEGVDIVFNAAAMKHVPFCEQNPFEAIKTNVYGTQNLVEAARAANVKKFIHVSTDKAAMPVNVMGATKLLSEKIVISAENYKGGHKTIFSAVRFGNVFGSRGSVVPLFHDQIKKGGPVTLTDKNMTRFMMRIPEAAELVLRAALLSKGGELFIFKMSVMRIEDLAKAMVELLSPRFGFKSENIKIKVVGRRPGEKIYELLMVDEESDIIYENQKMFCLSAKRPKGFTKSKQNNSRSDKTAAVTPKELVKILKDYFQDA